MGGKFLKLAGGKAIRAIGGLFSKGAEAAAEGTAESAGTAGAEGAAESAASSAEDSSAARAADEPSESAETESNCAGAPHSFAGSTRVLLANGKTKAIDQVKVGDEVKNAVPGVSGTETHKVERVIVTTTDHDFVDLKIAPKRPGRLTKAAVALAAGVGSARRDRPDDDVPPPVLRPDAGGVCRGQGSQLRRRTPDPDRHRQGRRQAAGTTPPRSRTTSRSTASTPTMWLAGTRRCWYTTAVAARHRTARRAPAMVRQIHRTLISFRQSRRGLRGRLVDQGRLLVLQSTPTRISCLLVIKASMEIVDS